MLRYALLRHDCPADYRDGPHWDLLLERAGVADERRLATWSLLELPVAWRASSAWRAPGARRAPGVSRGSEPPSAVEVMAIALADHRAHYLDYEGPLSGGRGEVSRVASGALEWIEASEALRQVRLLDGPLAGLASLHHVEGNHWSLGVKREC